MPAVNLQKRSATTLMALIIAGESIFFLPFVMARVFRPTLLTVFEVSNTEIGIWFSIYGIVAMISYLFGGTLADRIQARKLMALALWLTSAGGFVMVFIPPAGIMKTLYGFWGFTTVCLFWAAMIRATREWGGAEFQGRAFGWLEGGRGAVAALMGTLAYLLFSRFQEFHLVILAISIWTLGCGFMVWMLVPAGSTYAKTRHPKVIFGEVLRLIVRPSIWMLSVIIVCAYAGYKITDDFSLYARDVLGFSDVDSAGIGSGALWIRAIVAILAGYSGDWLSRVRVMVICFALTLTGSLLLGFGILDQLAGIVFLKLILTAIGIYGVRALYFAVMKEANVPLALTGTAVGIVCFIGFTPEIFMGPWMGSLLDRYPGAEGHHYVFLVLSLFAIIGLVTSLLFQYSTRIRKFNG